MRLVIGLGNPGPRYDGTRHNVGFDVVDRLAGRAVFRQGRGPYLVAETRMMHLVRPTTYMNLSGTAVAAACQELDEEPARALVVLDDVALPLGTLRLRRRGTDGGHNGLASVIEAAGTTEVPRLRLGVAPEVMPPAEMLAAFVLARFEPSERATVDRMVDRAAEAATMWAASGIEAAMNRFNTREQGDTDT